MVNYFSRFLGRALYGTASQQQGPHKKGSCGTPGNISKVRKTVMDRAHQTLHGVLSASHTPWGYPTTPHSANIERDFEREGPGARRAPGPSMLTHNNVRVDVAMLAYNMVLDDSPPLFCPPAGVWFCYFSPGHMFCGV